MQYTYVYYVSAASGQSLYINIENRYAYVCLKIKMHNVIIILLL